MRRKRFQNKVAASGVTLPAAAVLATLAWLLHGEIDGHLLGGWLLCAVTTAIVAETNNAYSLIRVRTRLASVVFLLGLAVMPWAHPFGSAGVAMACVAGVLYFLFRTYQLTEPVGDTFRAQLLLGVGSLLFPPLLLLAPFYLLCMGFYLRSLGPRAFVAALLGLVLPYWFWVAGCLYVEDFSPLLTHFEAFALPTWQDVAALTALPLLKKLVWGCTTVFTLVSTVYYLRTYYNDKIRTRMFCYILICQFFVLELLLWVQPQYFAVWLALLHLTGSFLTAHYFAVTRSRATNLLFILTLLIWVALAALSLYGSNY